MNVPINNDLVSIQRGAPAVAVQGRAAGREAAVHIETANNEQPSDSVPFFDVIARRFCAKTFNVLISPGRAQVEENPRT